MSEADRRGDRVTDAVRRWLLDASVDGVLAYDPALRLTVWSAGLERLTGLPARDTIGRPLSDVMPSSEDPPAGGAFRRALAGTRSRATIVFPGPGASGDVHVEAHVSPLEDGNGVVLGGVALLRDVTRPRRAERDLMESEARYGRLLEDALTGNFVATGDGLLVACNPSFAAIFGHASAEAALGTNVRDLFPVPEGYESFRALLGARRRLASHELVLRRADGEPVHVIANFVGVFDDAGRLTELRGYAFDDTEHKKLEEQVRQAQKMESLGTLAGGIAHDFNNILGIILSHVALLGRHAAEAPELAPGIDAIRTAADRGSGLVKQLLTFARRTDASFGRVDLNAAIDELLGMCVEMFPRSIEFERRLDDRAPAVMADPNQLHQALLNLCINARDAMREGGRLTLSTGVAEGRRLRSRHASADEGAVYGYVRVADTGTGMDEEAARRVFDPFYTTKEPGRGSGLGLAVVYGIVKGHSGLVDVKSEPGRGTAFTLYFPVAGPGVAEPIAPAAEPPRAAGGGETVLLVEDEELLLSAVTTLLEAEGYRVLPARDGEEALEAFGRSRVDVVLADLGLPRLGGWGLFQRLRERDPAIPMVLTSGFVDRGERGEMLAAGVDRILRKPYGETELLAAVRGALDAAARPARPQSR